MSRTVNKYQFIRFRFIVLQVHSFCVQITRSFGTYCSIFIHSFFSFSEHKEEEISGRKFQTKCKIANVSSFIQQLILQRNNICK